MQSILKTELNVLRNNFERADFLRCKTTKGDYCFQKHIQILQLLRNFHANYRRLLKIDFPL